jgi:Xaa-Pro aminopeptidase
VDQPIDRNAGNRFRNAGNTQAMTRAEGTARRWRGIGIRIEDDVVVTRDGPRVLSTGIPTTSADIEAWMN